MILKQTSIINKFGLHARPASVFSAKAKEFSSKICVRNCDVPGSRPINAKSVVNILSGGLAQGTAIEIMAEGSDEKEALKVLVALIESGFGE